MKIQKKQRIKNFSNKSQMWWNFLVFIFIIFSILYGVVYFFVYKSKSIPTIEPRREFAPAERGVLPENTLFPNRKK